MSSTTPAEKNCLKEGTKKAQSFSAINKQTRNEYFCALTENVHGEAPLLEIVMRGINADKKAAQWGKLLLTHDDSSVMALAHVPRELRDRTKGGMSAREWLRELRTAVPQLRMIENVNDGANEQEQVRAVITVEHGEELFPFKLCDALVQANFDVLKRRGMIAEQSSDDEDYASKAGVEW